MGYLILFVLGAIVGSFLHVVGTRWGSGLGARGRSFCPVCGHNLRWYELVPIASFMALRGRCRTCSAKIPWHYPAIEIWTGLIFASLYFAMGASLSYLAYLAAFCVYTVIAIYDLRHKVIPDALVYLSVIMALVLPVFIETYALVDWLAGPLIFAFFVIIWFVSKGRGIGFGDAKLGLSIGVLLGAAHGFSAVVLAFWIGAAAALAYMALGKISLLKTDKRLTMKSEIPFAPFMILGAWASVVFDLDLLNVALF